MGYFIKPGYVERAAPQYFDDYEDSQWQPDVYALAQFMTAPGGTIIDVGCGKANKLEPMIAAGFRVIGLDFGPNIAYCREHRPGGTWVEADLEDLDYAILPAADVKGATIILADVIEHLVDPMPLVITLLEWMRGARVALLSTPERDLYYGAEHAGPPPNTLHIREWNRAELEAFLVNCGLNVKLVALTRAHLQQARLKTSLAVIGPTR